MRKSWLYFATRSVRDSEPVLIWPAFVATARSAIVVSSVSPERCDMTHAYPFSRAKRIVSSVSVSVPIWLTLIRIAFATPSSMPRCNRSRFVTNTSSEEHTSELQSQFHLVCRLLLEKKKKKIIAHLPTRKKKKYYKDITPNSSN